MARPEKEAAVNELAEKLSGSRAAVLADYRGLNVGALTQLRRRLGEANVEFKVVKNTLTLIAAKRTGLSGLESFLAGPTAVAFAPGDPVTPAKIMWEFAREHKELAIKCGVLEGKVITADGVRDLAILPSREIMLGRVAAAVASPMSGLAGALSGVTRNLVYCVDAVRRQKEGAAA